MAMSPGEQYAQKNSPNQGGQVPQGTAPTGATSPEDNPILEAFRTIALYIAKKTEQGDPNAQEMQALLAQFVSLIQKDASGTQGVPGQAPVPQGQPPMQGSTPVPQMGPGVNPMMGRMQGKKMSNNVPVI